MTDYTPTTEEVRMAYGDVHCEDVDGDHGNGCTADVAFDRWLTEYTRVKQAEALEEAADALNRPAEGAGYEAWASGVGYWLRARAAEYRKGESDDN